MYFFFSNIQRFFRDEIINSLKKKSHNFDILFMSVGARKSKKAQLDDPNGNKFWILRENRTPDFG